MDLKKSVLIGLFGLTAASATAQNVPTKATPLPPQLHMETPLSCIISDPQNAENDGLFSIKEKCSSFEKPSRLVLFTSMKPSGKPESGFKLETIDGQTTPFIVGINKNVSVPDRFVTNASDTLVKPKAVKVPKRRVTIADLARKMHEGFEITFRTINGCFMSRYGEAVYIPK